MGSGGEGPLPINSLKKIDVYNVVMLRPNLKILIWMKQSSIHAFCMRY